MILARSEYCNIKGWLCGVSVPWHVGQLGGCCQCESLRSGETLDYWERGRGVGFYEAAEICMQAYYFIVSLLYTNAAQRWEEWLEIHLHNSFITSLASQGFLLCLLVVSLRCFVVTIMYCSCLSYLMVLHVAKCNLITRSHN